MTPPTVISVENLSKVYRLGKIGGRTLSEDLNRWCARFRQEWASAHLQSRNGRRGRTGRSDQQSDGTVG